jgi:sensor histidine kinase YesM
MLINHNQFEREFCKLERWAKFIGIPFFTIICILFLSPFPFVFSEHFTNFHFLIHSVFSLIGVASIWYTTRWISGLFWKYCKKMTFSLRLGLQISISCIVSVFSTLFLVIICLKYFELNLTRTLNSNGFNFAYEVKNLLVTVVLFTFLINTIYEGFYLFMRLSEKAIETERYKKESIEAQYKNLTSRLNPHFLFNSLNTLTTIVEEDSGKGVKYIQELSKVYRYVLNSQKNTWVDLQHEITFTQSYIQLLKMRFENNLIPQIDLCESYSSFYILPLTIQLLIENAVKHNEISDAHPLQIKVYCLDEMIIVTNNKQKRNIIPSSTKTGLQNIHERYMFLVNKKVIIEDLENSFTVKVPLIKMSQVTVTIENNNDKGVNY